MYIYRAYRRKSRPRLTFDAVKSVAVSIVGARLDYCNSLLHGTSQRSCDRLRRVQNSLARVVTQVARRSAVQTQTYIRIKDI